MASAPASCFYVSGEFVVISRATQLIVLQKSSGTVLTNQSCKSETASADGPDGSLTDVVITPDGQHLIACQNNKTVMVLETKTWSRVSTLLLRKKLMSVRCSADSTLCAVADRFGDVHNLSVPQLTPQNSIGHLAEVFCAIYSLDGKYLISCDKEKKVRVSRYPASYIIERFCFGHLNAVTGISTVNGDHDLLITASSDGTVRLWDFKNGKELSRWNVAGNGCTLIGPAVINNLVMVVEQGQSDVSVLSFDANQLALVRRMKLEMFPVHMCADNAGSVWFLLADGRIKILDSKIVSDQKHEGSFRMDLTQAMVAAIQAGPSSDTPKAPPTKKVKVEDQMQDS